MSTWYLYCSKCKKKGRIMTESQAEQYFTSKNHPKKETPKCCGKSMSVRSDDLLSGIF